MNRINWIALVIGALIIASLAAEVVAQGRRGAVLQLDEEKIKGEIEKPEAYYILAPSNLTYQQTPPEASFLVRLYETVEKAPF
ncbi:MAG: hypothetical protein HQ461_09605 [Deltaproteobacteria bacterium]|jgi:hypothetical protein|nr:hypothetical protein [Deltaproteobacteria bacterium]